MEILIPFISAWLFWFGGRDQMNVPFNPKLFRWVFFGCWLTLCTLLHHFTLVTLLLLPCFYFLATNVMGYGENHVLRKLFGKDIQWILYGVVLGLCSFLALSWLSLLQGVISGISTWVLLKWSNDGFHKLPYIGDKIPALYGSKLSHQWAELGIGLMGTLMYIWLR